ncbi:MAG TPA: SIMPL domain-containing protein [Marinobacter sp.]|nr:SIMPL domain-containing protein [Marinobacter sp.]
MPKCSQALALTTALIAGGLPAMAAYAGEVSLNGEGIVTYSPDSARLQFTVSAEHNLPEKASKQVADTMNQWREGIRNLRSQLEDYSDAEVNLYTRSLPVQERGQEPEQRTVASQTVSFSISDLELLNPLLEQAQKLGLQYHLGSHQFYHSNEQDLQRQALARAIDDARDQCRFVAEQLDKRCGDVVTINISGGHRPVPMMMAEAKSAGNTVSSVGPREVRASVSATFELD